MSEVAAEYVRFKLFYGNEGLRAAMEADTGTGKNRRDNVLLLMLCQSYRRHRLTERLHPVEAARHPT